MSLRVFPVCVALALNLAGISSAAPFSTNANRLTYLDSDDPFYVGRDFPKLTTPQWVGEEGVDAVVVLSIDDMRETPKYEATLRPILERLKKIDGRAPVSIMVNAIAPTNAQLQSWLKEGLSLETHTVRHPCPLCQGNDFNAAARTYHDCVDAMNEIPGNRAVAFRMPCCDSMNSPTPRFYSEMFNRSSAKGNFLSIDSSVMLLLTTNDASLPRELVMDSDGRERFRKYLPTETNAMTRVSMGSFTTTIEDYPYPYVIGKLCWEFPCIVPSDWEANNLHQPNNPKTVEDWQRALDAIVLKQGVMTLIFHPHGWIQSTQMVEFIDYAMSKYGRRVKFLNFREAQERLQRNLFVGQPLRRSDDGGDNGVRLLDVNNDGFMDVTLGFQDRRVTRIWEPSRKSWRETAFTMALISSNPDGSRFDTGVKFGVVRPDGHATAFGLGVPPQGAWHFDGADWTKDEVLGRGVDLNAQRINTRRDAGVRMRDIDRDGQCELIVANEAQNALFKWSNAERRWNQMPFALPGGTRIVDQQGRDAGLRFVDVDDDGYDDVIFSNHERYSLHLFRADDRKLRLKPGWTDEVLSGIRSNALTDPIPPIARYSTNRNNGVWFKNRTMWIQNEDTAILPDRVDRRSFKQLLSGFQPKPLSPEESLKSFQLPRGFKIELVASEPLIQSPVAFEWSADGKLWVVEMGDYPQGIDGEGRGGGRLRVLEDLDGDGRCDKATSFLEDLNFPTGLYPWRNGVIVSAAPDIFFAADTNGDGKADVRERLFTGFVEGNQQHRMNGFDYGLDGWLYGANGDSGGNVRALNAFPLSPQRGEGWERAGSALANNTETGRGNQNGTLNLRGHDFRIQPDKRMIELVEGQTQFGRHRDDFGNWFGNNNPTWLWHYFFPEHYLARNPFLPLRTTKKVLANYEDSGRVFPASRTMSRFNDPFAENHVTSGNSATPYRDDLFGPGFASSVFISEPVHNCVHREVLEPDGVTFRSHRASEEKDREFLASNDNWFRPTMLKTGPDGALYVAAMYRLVIEHPEWIPLEMQRRLELRAGADKGRIYRIVPDGSTLRPIPNLAKLSSDELAAAIGSSNGWQRDTAQRLLIERGDKSVVSKLERHARSAKDAKVRVQALWTLRGLGALTPRPLVAGLKDNHAAVREHAVRLSEAQTDDSELFDALVTRVGDSSPRVRYQLAFSLGEWNDARAAEPLLKLARDNDENIRNAALSSAPRHAKELLALANKVPNDDRVRSMSQMVRKLMANPPALTKVIAMIERTNTLSAAQRTERAKVLAQYTAVPNLKADAHSGAALFRQNCAQCHRLRGEGAEIGPDLATLAGKPVETLVTAILDPNAAMEARYQNFNAILKDGREVSGILVGETVTSLTLRAPNRADETILRTDVKELTASGLSLMPENLEAAMNPQQVADLIGYILGR